MEDDLIDHAFIASLNTKYLYNYFEKVIHEYHHLVQHKKGLKSKYFIIVQRNIADTFTWDDYHQRVRDYQQENADFAFRVLQKERQLEYISNQLRQRIEHDRSTRNT